MLSLSPSFEPQASVSFKPDVLLGKSFTTIDLSDLGEAALLNRVETKYLLTKEQLEQILTTLLEHYLVLDAYGTENPYQSLYFDTPDFALYHRHHAGAKGRYKLRSRRYCASDSSFFEVKFKDNHSKTFKKRMATAELVTSVENVSNFIKESFPRNAETLAPVLESRYCRITLVSPAGDERVTIDTGLEFRAEGKTVSLPSLVIAEVKRENRRVRSSFIDSMKDLHILPHSLSKYCLGISQLYPVKHNRFKPTLRHLKKLTELIHA